MTHRAVLETKCPGQRRGYRLGEKGRAKLRDILLFLQGEVDGDGETVAHNPTGRAIKEEPQHDASGSMFVGIF